MTPYIASLEGHLKTNLLGQDEALSATSRLLRRSLCGMRFPDRPVASMLLLGPTGVGKTQSVNLFTEHLFGSHEHHLIRFDMSEYMLLGAVERLIGNQLGDRGLFGHFYDKTGGRGTLLFDEIEKAHEKVLDIFLQILSAGRFTLANGEVLDLRNYVVAATSNVGSRAMMESRSTDYDVISKRVLDVARSELRPELLGRFDLLCAFNRLDYLALNRIAELHLRKALDIAVREGHSIRVGSGVLDYIRKEGYDETYGARPMQRAALNTVGDAIADEMIINGMQPVTGSLEYDRKKDRCYLVL